MKSVDTMFFAIRRMLEKLWTCLKWLFFLVSLTCISFISAYSDEPLKDSSIYRDFYFATKRSFDRLLIEQARAFEEQGGTLELHPPITSLGITRPNFDIFNCASSDVYGSFYYKDKKISQLSDLAHGLSSVKHSLRAYAIPGIFWRSDMIKFEDKVLSKILRNADALPWSEVNEFSKLLAPRINSRTEEPLPAVRAEGECGAAEISIKVSTDPASARLFMVPLLFWYVCDELGIESNDVTNCEFWTEVPSGTEKVEVAGDYRYVALWSDGQSTSGTMRFHYEIEEAIIVTPNGLISR